MFIIHICMTNNTWLHAFFYKQHLFLIQPQCCLPFSWTEFQMLLRCCLVHISIIILGRFIYLLYLCPYLHLQSFTEYLRLTVVFMWNSTVRENFNFYFSRVFCQYFQFCKKFSFGRATGTRLSFYEVLRISWFFLIS